ncbi:MAG: hypothetical protein V4590_09890 [Bacteroidota bacterium]
MKNLFLLFAFATSFAVALAGTPFNNGKVVLLVTIEVKDFDTWKKNFDSGAAIREKAGIKVISICASPENPNMLTIIEEAENAQAAHDFILKLKAVRQKQGDNGTLNVQMLDKLN